MVSSMESDGGLLHRSINACLCPIYAVEGMAVVTVEGIGNPRDGLHPVQERLASAHGSQCGFCTPGFVMSMYSLLRSKAGQAITEDEIEENLAGNLCRCTGYRPIIDAFRGFATVNPSAYTEDTIKAAKGDCAVSLPKSPSFICPSTGRPCGCGDVDAKTKTVVSMSLHKEKGCGSLEPCKTKRRVEPIFPPELRSRRDVELHLPGSVATWHRPMTLDRLLELKWAYPESKLVVGNTEVGIEMKFKNAGYPRFIAVTHIPELNEITVTATGVCIGASITLTKMMETFKELARQLPKHQTQTLQAVVRQLKWFAGPPIRNAASVGGNIVTASPISDLNPIWFASGATVAIAGQGTEVRSLPMKEFIKGYRRTDLADHEVLVSIFVPFTKSFEYVREFKQAHRREDDIAIVNAGVCISMQQQSSDTWVIAKASIAYGGVAPATISAPNTETALIGRPLNQGTVKGALGALREDVRIDSTAPGGMVEYRQSLAASFLFKALVHTAVQLEADDPASSSALGATFLREDLRSAASEYVRAPSNGLQYYTSSDNAAVGLPMRHLAAGLQVCGEAQYVDDIPGIQGLLHAAFVVSSKPHAKILNVNVGPGLDVHGVVGIYQAKDVPGGNDIGPAVHDEELFATEVVTCVGQPIAIVAAETEAAARAAARAVIIEYEDLTPLLDIDAARHAESYYKLPNTCVKSAGVDASSVIEKSEGDDNSFLLIEGEVKMGGQEHFYLEPNACVVYPGEGGEILSWSSTQCVDKHQQYIAHCLGIPQHRIVVKTKRLGGGFGGKETRAAFINAAVAIAAYHTQRPVKIVLDRDEDMSMTGQRHAFAATYRVLVDKRNAHFVAVDMDVYNNAGNSLDLSAAVMDRALTHCDNVYKWPAFRARGSVCRTHLPSNTAFRGFGGPQGMHITETIVDHISRVLDRSPEDIRAANMYKSNDLTPAGQLIEECNAKACWDVVWDTSGYEARRGAVEEYNKRNRYRKRGLALIPTKFGISFTLKFMNQAGALVHLYRDGSVLLTHGGAEMGQGLHVKVAQVVAQALGVPLEDVHIAETSTDKVPNASPTAASASSDLYGAAAADACRQLNERLAPFRATAGPQALMKDIASAAYMQRIDLCAHGFYATPNITGAGGDRPANYFCYGAAAAEVELDTLTGDWHILRADICMDVGQSLNPAIDIGQVEGAFVQGVGWSCIEELVWGDEKHTWVKPGVLHTRGPGTYKIPTANDIPVDFRVTLLRDSPCKETPAVHSSKAVGEPPFFLGTSVFWALKEACYSARADAGVKGYFKLDLPATPERLRMACIDEFTRDIVEGDVVPKLSC